MKALKKHTLVIDGAYFLHSRLYVLPRPKHIPGLPVEKFMSSEKDQHMLMRKLCIDLASELRKIRYTVDRIVFTMDAKSWRKDFFPDSGYKANREHDEKIDWKGINNVTDDFLKIIQKLGVIVNRIPGAEGDDLIFAWATYLNSVGENTIIWSGDKDLIQLVNYNRSTDAYTLWYDNTRSKFIGYPGFKRWLDTNENDKDEPIDIYNPINSFYLIDQVKKEMKEFFKLNNLETSEVFCDDFILAKILTGDKSDNISSVCEKPSKKGDKIFRLSEKKAKKIVDLFKKRHTRFSSVYLFEDEYKSEICKLISREMAITGRLDEIKSKLELNTTLMLLHVSTIPEVIQTSMFNQIKNDFDNPQVMNILNLIDKDKILEDTKYLISNKIGNSSEPPKGGVGGLF